MKASLEQQRTDLFSLPASSGQQRFWVLDQLKPGDPSLNVAVRFGLTGNLHTAALERAIQEVIRRHEILRSNFEMADGHVTQLVAASLTIPVPLRDLRHLPEAQRWKEADRLAEEEARKSFHLSAGPLLRAGLLRLDEREHMLLITLHHIVCDGWSVGIFTDELGPLYEAFAEGRPTPLPELAIQYADYTIWEQEHRDANEWAEAEAYWKQQLDGLPRFSILADRPRLNADMPAGEILSRLLPLDLTTRLRDLSLKHEATLFMTMLTALVTLLTRYTGETDVVVGSQVAGRNTVDVEPLIGPFINTLVLRHDTSGNPTFSEMLARVKQVVLKALEFQQLPLERVAEILRIDRSLDSNLMFQVNFIYQRDFVHPWTHAGVSLRPIPSKSPGAMYDLNLFLVERAEGWRVSCEYNTELYFERTIARLLEHFERLLTGVLANADRPLAEYRLLTSEEFETVVHRFNQTAMDYPSSKCAHRLFEEQVERSPESVAAVCGRESVTYRQLNRRANQLARYLRTRGLGPGMLAGICVERSVQMLVAALAVWKTGAAYVPLDPSFPRDRLSFMAEDAGLRVLITQESLAGIIKAASSSVLLDDEHSQIIREEHSNLPGENTPDGLAYVIYTSGSTGQPKGVEIPHQALVNLLWAVIRSPGISPRDSLLAVTTLSFDIAGLELFGPLLAGARVIIATQAEASGGVQLRQAMAAGGATILQATPATWRMLIDAGWQNTPQLKMLCGGETLTRELADALLARGGELWNMYGPTETTIWSSWRQIEPSSATITVGRPAPNQSFYVLDAHRRPAPAGVPGELCIGGAGVAAGYHKRPDLTAERFIANPFGAGRLYRTGDRARMHDNGEVEILGRLDTQVKIRGFRIELGEVEAAVAGCALVRAGAVAVRADASGDSALAAYVVPVLESPDLAEMVRAHLRSHLPEYMVPTYVVPLKELPKTPNGKVDRKALPAPEAVLSRLNAGEAEPHDPLEMKLIGIWEAVLGVKPIGRRDNFFEIGGHSVLAAKMFARMEKALGKSLPLATLFQGPTVEKLAALLRDGGWTPPWSSLVPIRAGGQQPPFFFVHPIGGNVLTFAGIANYFDADQPIYGLQAKGLDGKQSPNTEVETMAADYVREIRTLQPAGPYYLGGFSAGGIVAFEMARILRDSGERVGMLAFLDTKVESRAESRVAASTELFSRLVRTLRFNAAYIFQIGLPNFLETKLKNMRLRWNIRLWLLRKALHLPPGALDAEEAFLAALRTYDPKPYAVDAILFRAKDETLRAPDASLGWSKLVQGRLTIQYVSGNHDTILSEPHIGRLARLLNSLLQAAHQERSPEAAEPPPSYMAQ